MITRWIPLEMLHLHTVRAVTKQPRGVAHYYGGQA